MLALSSGQMQAVAGPQRAAWVARVRSFLEQQAPRLLVPGGTEADDRVAAALSEAAELGIASEQEQVLYVSLALLHGQRFAWREPWASSIVQAHRVAGRETGLAVALKDAAPARGAGG